MFIRAPYLLSFILVVCCWFRLNAAVPFASRPSEASRTRHTLKNKQIDSQRYDITAQSRTLKNAEDFSDSSSSDGAKRINKIKNRNINLIFGHHTSNYKEDKQNIPKKIPLFYHPHLKRLENIYEEKQSANCSSGKKDYQRYSSSFDNITNRALTIDKEFKQVVGNNSKVKTSSSVHEDEDISLCWIETTTIKENKTVRPLKKLLVIREYTISFENSATIPDEYLECKKFEGESTTNDNDIGKTALYEIIDENTKISKVVNFTSVSHVGDIIIWQHKKVKCGVGPVVSKNVIEWNDGSKIPKKRVEIKVSPKIKTGVEEICTESATKGKKSGKPADVTTESRENAESGICEITTKSNDISKSSIEISVSKERTTESKEAGDESEEDQNTGITKPFLLPVAELFTTTIFPTLLITKKDILSCEEDSSDPLCKQKNITQSSKEAVIESGVTEESPQITTVEKELSSSSELREKELPVTTPESIDFSTQEVDFTTSRVTEKKEGEHLISEKDKDTISIELSSEKLNTVDYVPSSSINTITSNQIGETTQEVTVTVSPLLYGFTEFAKESEKSNSILNKLTESSISTESGITESFKEIKQTASSSTTSNGIIDYSCENSEECASANSPESCNENCVKSCESGICSTEETEKSNTVLLPLKNQSFTIDSSESTTTLSPQEIENYATINNVVTRRSTTRRSMPQHKLTLKVKVLLEHIDENEEKHNLVEVEKQLSFNEDSERRHSDLLKQLKFLNESVNRETLSALLNYTSLNNLTKKSKITSNEVVDDSHTELEFTNPSSIKDFISDQPSFEQENEDFQYFEDSSMLDQESDQENEVLSRRRKRRSLDDKIEEKSSTTDSPYNTLKFSTKEAIHPSTTINNLEKETSSAACVENKRNITIKGENDRAPFLLNDTDYDTNLTTLEYQNVNVTQESIQLFTTTNNPEEETYTLRTESDTTTEIILNTVPSIKENIGNETKMEIVQQTLSGIQEDVSVGLQHVVSKLAQSNLTLNNTEKDQTNLPGVTADHKADKIYSRIKRAAEEEIGYWSNERVREASMGGNLRSITQITLYKIFS